MPAGPQRRELRRFRPGRLHRNPSHSGRTGHADGVQLPWFNSGTTRVKQRGRAARCRDAMKARTRNGPAAHSCEDVAQGEVQQPFHRGEQQGSSAAAGLWNQSAWPGSGIDLARFAPQWTPQPRPTAAQSDTVRRDTFRGWSNEPDLCGHPMCSWCYVSSSRWTRCSRPAGRRAVAAGDRG